ncbi:MAG: helix-turn-helix transcriptional regulator [Parcubacteria group bacterium]|nr:helix-turn-helix transcriptional regulator [Parcubacteria group bacterium]
MKRPHATITYELRDMHTLNECAARFGIVGDATRIKICWLLCKHPELTVGTIARLLHVSDSVVSHSLRRLKENRLVETRREAKQVFYRFASTKFNALLKEFLT